MARGATDNRNHVKIERTPEERERIRAVRERYRRERPTPEGLAAGGGFEGPVLHGPYLELREFAGRLKAARLAAGLTLKEVAERAGFDAAYVSRLETGRSANPTFDSLGRCAAAVGKRITLGLDEPADAGS